MNQTVYADLYVIVNTGMDLLCLLITAALCHRRTSRMRTILAAALGGGYALLALLLNLDGLLGILPDLAAALLICSLAFASAHPRGKERLWERLRITGVFVLVSALMGGAMTALYSLLNRLAIPFPALEGDGLSAWVFLGVSVASAIFTAKGGRLFASSSRQKTVTLHLRLFDKEIRLVALVDTGNLLSDPISGRDVIVADLEKLSPILPPDLVRACREKDPSKWLLSQKGLPTGRLIQANTAGGDTLLLALTPQRLWITRGRERMDCNHLIAPARLQGEAAGFDAVIGSF